jgi:hypothetical protein
VNEPSRTEQFEPAHTGLCAACKHMRRIAARSTFYLCSRSFINPAFAKYPSLPVVKCDGFEKGEMATG